ncbi:MAG TPA: 2-C-methyl-D-erythritol 4-phosphate cytidylyltransferase [bacterium]|nr:2-C-methyl-D-erythritol 4-phosphate cytidylyltransferase [bacterium]
MSEPHAAAVLVAAGRGERLGAGMPKGLVPVAGIPMLVHAARALEGAPLIEHIVAVVAPGSESVAADSLDRAGCERVRAIVPGGDSRQASVAAGLAALGEPQIVVVHDAARPLVGPAVITAVIHAAVEAGAASAGIPVRETVKRVEAGSVAETVDRDTLWIARTPQAFHTGLLREAHARAAAEGFTGADDAVLVERMGRAVRMVEDSPANLKITVPEDLRLAEAVLGGAAITRTGIGFDTHRLEIGRRLRLGGVDIPSPRGLAGHSDADVLVHAMMDALLGAAGLGDIGARFPPGDSAYRGADSLVLLGRVGDLVVSAGWRPVHLDSTVIAETPYLAPYIAEMRHRIAGALHLAEPAVSIKATTAEGMGALGRGEGIAAYALATLVAAR